MIMNSVVLVLHLSLLSLIQVRKHSIQYTLEVIYLADKCWGWTRGMEELTNVALRPTSKLSLSTTREEPHSSLHHVDMNALCVGP